jgi:hypothetical protein
MFIEMSAHTCINYCISKKNHHVWKAINLLVVRAREPSSRPSLTVVCPASGIIQLCYCYKFSTVRTDWVFKKNERKLHRVIFPCIVAFVGRRPSPGEAGQIRRSQASQPGPAISRARVD